MGSAAKRSRTATEDVSERQDLAQLLAYLL